MHKYRLVIDVFMGKRLEKKTPPIVLSDYPTAYSDTIHIKIGDHLLSGKQYEPKLVSFSQVRKSGGGFAKAKGRGFETQVGEKLGKWWWGKPFRHTPGSGAWDKQATDGQLLAPGDLVIPKESNCPFFVECKKAKVISRSDILGWWEKSLTEAITVGRVPFLIIAEDYKKIRLVLDTHNIYAFNMNTLNLTASYPPRFSTELIYYSDLLEKVNARNYVCSEVSFDEFLKVYSPKDFTRDSISGVVSPIEDKQ